MFGWLRKKQEKALPTLPSRSFFATDLEPLTGTSLDVILNRSFQKTIKDFSAKQMQPDGSFVAMDSADFASLKTEYLNGYRTQGINDVQVEWYAGQGFIGYQICALISQHWLVNKAISMPAKDAVRHGYDTTVNDGTEVKPEVIDYIRKRDKHFKIKKHCREFVRKGRMFGIRVALFKVDSPDPLYYDKPFNPDGIKKGAYKGIAQIDPYWMSPELDAESVQDPSSLNFYTPTWWRIQGKRYHYTHLVIYIGDEVADTLRPSYMFGGLSVPQKIAERVFAAERTANEGPKLAMSKRMTVLKTDMTQAAAEEGSFLQKLAVWMGLMNNFGVKVVGGDEEVTQFETSLADLDNVIMNQFQLVSAASDVPATKLLGTTPKGFNSTGEFESKSYHEELESIQENYMSPLVEKHHICLMRSEVAPKFGIQPFELDTTWKPADSPTASELADINYKNSQTDSNYVNMGALNGAQVQRRLIANPDSGYTGMEESEEDLLEEEENDETADQAQS